MTPPTVSPPDTPFTVIAEPRTSVAPFSVLTVRGELDVVTAPRLQEVVERLVAEGGPRLVLDVHHVTFCDCRGLAVFALAHTRCTELGGWAALAGPSPQLVRILELTGLADHLLLYPTMRSVPACRAPSSGVSGGGTEIDE